MLRALLNSDFSYEVLEALDMAVVKQQRTLDTELFLLIIEKFFDLNPERAKKVSVKLQT